MITSISLRLMDTCAQAALGAGDFGAHALQLGGSWTTKGGVHT